MSLEDKKKEMKLMFEKDLLEKRTLYLIDTIDNEAARRLGAEIIWLNAKSDEKITLYINSSGGDIAAGLDIYDIIKHSKAPITGIVYRQANSMAIIALQACKSRKAMSHSEICFHNMRLGLHLEWNEFEKIKDRELQKIKERQEDYNKIISKRSGIDIKIIEQWCKEKKILSPEEALGFNLIDEII